MDRPTLIPGLPRTWRNPTRLQVGRIMLDLPDPRVAGVLDLLDGSRTERCVLVDAASLGVPPQDARAVIDQLHIAGLALPAASLLPGRDRFDRRTGEAAALAVRGSPAPAAVVRRRSSARVLICGRSRLGAAVAVALAESGVGTVQPAVTGTVTPDELAAGPLHASDVGQSRRQAISAAVSRAVPAVATSGVRRGAATLVVQLDHDEPVSLLAAAHARRRQPHLAVTVHEGAVVVGPLVPAAGTPCLNCIDLHRRDRDATWSGPARGNGAEPCTVATLLAGTAVATAEVLAFLDGGTPETLGASLEVAAPARARRRTWPPHERCHCARRPTGERGTPRV